MCRGADPESKGKIENVVKYIKGNFLNHRMYTDDGILNGSCLEWLERTANAKVHGTTKLVPTEVFQEEREYLRPLLVCDQAKCPVICRTVRKDNTIIYNSRDVLELVEARNKVASTIFCSQFDTGEWHENLYDPTLADAICDRIVYNAYTI